MLTVVDVSMPYYLAGSSRLVHFMLWQLHTLLRSGVQSKDTLICWDLEKNAYSCTMCMSKFQSAGMRHFLSLDNHEFLLEFMVVHATKYLGLHCEGFKNTLKLLH